MYEKKVTVLNETGLHARPATQFSNFVKKYPNNIQLVYGEQSYNPKSIINILAAGLNKGAEILVRADGDNAKQVVDEIVDFIQNLRD